MSLALAQSGSSHLPGAAVHQDHRLIRGLVADEDFASAVSMQHLHAAASAAVSCLKALQPQQSPTCHEDISQQSVLHLEVARSFRSIESAQQASKSSRSAGCQMSDWHLPAHPLHSNHLTQSLTLPGYPRSADSTANPIQNFGEGLKQKHAQAQQSLHGVPLAHHPVQLRGIPRPAHPLTIPAGSGAVLAHAPSAGAMPFCWDSPHSLTAAAAAPEPAHGHPGFPPQIHSAGLDARLLSEEQTVAAAVQLASHAAPLAKLAAPIFSDGLTNVLQDLRREMVQFEEAIPWTAVRKHWRTKRSTWRRSVREADSTLGMAACLRDLQAALLLHAPPGHPNASRAALNLGPVWQQSLVSCLEGDEKHTMLLALWNDFKKQVSLWLGAISLQPAALSAQPSRTKAARALRALLRAEAQGADAVMQVPLDAILNGDSEALETMKAVLSQEQLHLAARCEEVSKGSAGHCQEADSEHASMLETFVFASEDGFDSGAESVDECSQATDMCESD